jgi:hypothetical protein
MLELSHLTHLRSFEIKQYYVVLYNFNSGKQKVQQ